MTNTLQIIDLAGTGQVQLSVQTDETCQTAPPAPFQDPLDATDREEIRWYFHDYLSYPFGEAKARAEAVETLSLIHI